MFNGQSTELKFHTVEMRNEVTFLMFSILQSMLYLNADEMRYPVYPMVAGGGGWWGEAAGAPPA